MGSSGGTTAAAPAETATPTPTATVGLSLTETGCDPVTLTALAGAVTFNVDNARDAKAEFEILSATPKILTEEFLEPGASGSFTVDLVAGDYQVICGRPSDTRAAYTVTGEGRGATLKVDEAALTAAATAYKASVLEQADILARTAEFATAVESGDVEQAKALYAPGRIPWETIEPVAELFPDVDGAIDSRVDDHKGPDDPEWTGWHRIEKGLWEDNSTEGPHPVRAAAGDRHQRSDEVKALHDRSRRHDQRCRGADRGSARRARSPVRRSATATPT